MRQNVLIIDFLNKLKSFYFAHKDKIKTANYGIFKQSFSHYGRRCRKPFLADEYRG